MMMSIAARRSMIAATAAATKKTVAMVPKTVRNISGSRTMKNNNSVPPFAWPQAWGEPPFVPLDRGVPSTGAVAAVGAAGLGLVGLAFNHCLEVAQRIREDDFSFRAFEKSAQH